MKAHIPRSFVSMVFQSFIIVFQASPLVFILEYAFTLLDAIALVVSVQLVNRFFDDIGKLAEGKIPFAVALESLAVFALVKILDEAVDGVAQFLGEYHSGRCNKAATGSLNSKTARLSPLLFEDRDFLDLSNQAYRGATVVRKLVHVIMDAVSLYVPYFVFMCVFLVNITPLLPLIMLLLFVPIVVGHLIRARYYSDLEDQTIGIRRKQEHYRDCLCSRTYLKETRLFGATHSLLDAYRKTVSQVCDLRWKAESKSRKVEFVTNTLKLIGFSGVVALLVALTVAGQVSVGTFAAILMAIIDMREMMEEVIEYRFGELSQCAAQIGKYYQYLDVPEGLGFVPLSSVPTELRLDKVSLSYPSSSVPALKEVSIVLPAGAITAIVGENGSGKTTLAKVILGLYIPDAGTVSWGGVPQGASVQDTRGRENVSCVFQDFTRYNMTLRDNVKISDMTRATADDQVWTALGNAGFGAERHRMKDLDTLLGKEFGGTEVSKGEWQRIAIARSIHRGYSLIVMDEPSSAIDPLEEAQVYGRLLELKRNSSSVVITHRMGLVRMADNVILMRDGCAVAQGRHEDLLESQPYYRGLWEAQQKYMR